MFTFVELPPFEELRDDLFGDDELGVLQRFLCDNPEAGAVIPGTGVAAKYAGQPKERASAAGLE